MTYTHPGPAIEATKQNIRQQLAALRRLEAAIQAEAIAKEQHLFQLYAERRRWQRAGSYTPSADAIAYREKYGHIIAAQPRPIHGGTAGLAAATAEAENWEARKKRQHN